MKFKILLEICCVLTFEFNFNVGNKKNYCLKKPNQPIQSKPHWFCLVWFVFYFQSQPKQPNCILFYLADEITFSFKTELNCITNTSRFDGQMWVYVSFADSSRDMKWMGSYLPPLHCSAIFELTQILYAKPNSYGEDNWIDHQATKKYGFQQFAQQPQREVPLSHSKEEQM